MNYKPSRESEHINYSREHPLREVLKLCAGTIIVVLSLTAITCIVAGYSARLLPVKFERMIFSSFRTKAKIEPPAVIQETLDRAAASKSACKLV